MTEFWESSFRDKQEMWGWEPADSAIRTLELFKKSGFNKILIPGFGYGRNAKIFLDNGFKVTGIEISETAIELAKNALGIVWKYIMVLSAQCRLTRNCMMEFSVMV